MKPFATILLLFFLIFYNKCFSQNKKEIDSINGVGYVYISNNLISCKTSFIKNILNSKKIKYIKGLADSHYNLATCDALLGDYNECVKNYLSALNYYEILKNHEKIARIYADIGYRIRYIDYKKGCLYFQKAISYGKKYNINKEMGPIYNNYGETIKNENLDSAIYFYNLSLSIVKKFKDSVSIPFSLNKLVEAYAKKKMFKKSFEYLKESDIYRYRQGDLSGIADNIAYRADVYYEIPQIDSAIKYYLKSYELSKLCKYNALERFCSNCLSVLYKKKNDFKNAFLFFEINKKLEDSVLSSNVKNEMAHLEIKYDSERKNRSIAENEMKLLKNQRYLFVVFSLLILLLFSIYFIIRFQKLKRERKINEIILSQKFENIKKEKEFADEKMRIARELHDNIGSHLTFIISSLDNIDYLKNEDNKFKKIKDITLFGRQTMKDLRDTIWAMNHDDGNIEVLLTRLSELRNIIPSNLQIHVHSHLDKELPLSGLYLLNFYRIIQEFIQNTVKYANANNIEINFIKNNNYIELIIMDDGVGFDLKNSNLGNGILNMKRRCEEMNGQFSIFTSYKNGTKIICIVPIMNKKEHLKDALVKLN